MKPILFIDFHGTLSHDRFWKTLDEKNFAEIQRLLFSQDNSIISDWMKGGYSSEEINKLIAKELGISFEGIWKIFVSDCKTMAISKNNLRLINKLRKKYKVILITDNMDCFKRFVVPSQKLDLFFDLIVSSFELKKFKTDNGGEILKQLVDEGGVNMEECVLIDDSINTCRLFSSLGGSACLVTATEPLEYWLEKFSSEDN